MLDSSIGRTYNYGIITFYREQVNEIYKALAKVGIFTKDESGNYVLSRNYLSEENKSRDFIKIGTVDAFQGMEFDIVYLSMVRSNNYVLPKDANSSAEGGKTDINKLMQRKYGFLMYENRLCVAMSRQKKALICVGDSGMLKGNLAERAIPALTEYYKLCKESDYGKILF